MTFETLITEVAEERHKLVHAFNAFNLHNIILLFLCVIVY